MSELPETNVKSKMSGFIVRKMTLNDVSEVLKLATEVGFKMGKFENQILLKCDPGGILVAEDNETG